MSRRSPAVDYVHQHSVASDINLRGVMPPSLRIIACMVNTGVPQHQSNYFYTNLYIVVGIEAMGPNRRGLS